MEGSGAGGWSEAGALRHCLGLKTCLAKTEHCRFSALDLRLNCTSPEYHSGVNDSDSEAAYAVIPTSTGLRSCSQSANGKSIPDQSD